MQKLYVAVYSYRCSLFSKGFETINRNPNFVENGSFTIFPTQVPSSFISFHSIKQHSSKKFICHNEWQKLSTSEENCLHEDPQNSIKVKTRKINQYFSKQNLTVADFMKNLIVQATFLEFCFSNSCFQVLFS